MNKIVIFSLVSTMLIVTAQADETQDKAALAAEISALKAKLSSLETQMKVYEPKKIVTVTQEDMFTTHTELGYIGTTGNTDTSTFNLESKITKDWGKYKGSLLFDGQYADDKGIESKNKFFVELVYDYTFTDRLAFNYLFGYKSDKFSAFDYQLYTGPGIKYKAIVSDAHNLSLEVSALYSLDEYSQVDYADAAKTVPIDYPNAANIPTLASDPSLSDDYIGYRAKAVYKWQILNNLAFAQELSYRSSLEYANKYFVYSKSGFISKISDIFSAGISYKLDYVNEPGDKEPTDTTLTANLIVDY